MRIVVFGPSGLVGREIIRQCLINSRVDSILALSRRPLEIPDTTGDTAKLTNVILKDFTQYSDDVKSQLATADGCIWALGVTPAKSQMQAAEQVKTICQTYTMAALQAIVEARGTATTSRFRFLYFSGHGIVRELAKKPLIMGEYLSMRAETERKVMAFATEHSQSGIEACVARPGLITSDAVFLRSIFINVGSYVGVQKIAVNECAAAVIQQVIDGFETEPLTNADLVRLGRSVLDESSKT